MRNRHLSSPSIPACPFVAGPKITDPRFFVGRKQELARLTAALEGPQPTSINLVGDRRIGESSLLYHFFQTCGERVRRPEKYIVVYLSLQEAKTRTRKGFYLAVTSTLGQHPM